MLADLLACATCDDHPQLPQTHVVQKGDDVFDQYRKRMQLAYRFRPNPLVRCTWGVRVLFMVLW